MLLSVATFDKADVMCRGMLLYDSVVFFFCTCKCKVSIDFFFSVSHVGLGATIVECIVQGMLT